MIEGRPGRAGPGGGGGRSGVFLPATLALAAVLVILGSLGASVTSSGRRAIEQARARRLAGLAADSAIEETCARLEGSLSFAALADPESTRDLAREAVWPRAVRTTVSEAEMAGHGVTLKATIVRIGPWRVQVDASSAGSRFVREIGILELEVPVQVRYGTRIMSRRVIVRRYAAAVPGSDPSRLVLRVGTADLTHEDIEG